MARVKSRHRTRGWLRWATWLMAGALGAVVLVIAAAWLILRSNSFQGYLLRLVERRAGEALGTEVKLAGLRLELAGLSPSLDLEGVVVARAGPYTRPPVLTAEHVYAGIQITSLLRRAWYLREVSIDHPVVNFREDRLGRTDLPANLTAAGGPSIFDLAVRHLLVSGGVVNFNDQSNQITFDANDLQVEAKLDPHSQRYTAQVSYRGGRIETGRIPPMRHNLAATIAATRSGLNVEALRIESPGLSVEATVRWQNYREPDVAATYWVRFDAGAARRLLGTPLAPIGLITLNGTARYRVADGITAEGHFASGSLNETLAGVELQAKKLSGGYRLRGGDLEMSAVRADALGGRLEATLTLKGLGGASQGQFEARLLGAAIGQAAALARPAATVVRQLGAGGRLDGTVQGQWRGGLKHLEATGTIDVTAAVAGAGNTSIPVAARLAGRWDAGVLPWLDGAISAGKSSLSATGTADELRVEVRTADLAELETLADRIHSAFGGGGFARLELAGAGSFKGKLIGLPGTATVRGRLGLDRFEIRGSRWQSLTAMVAASSSGAEVRDGRLTAATSGSVRFDGSLALQDWHYDPSNPLRIDAHIRDLPLAALQSALGRQLPLSGMLTGTISVHGTPRMPVGQGSISVRSAGLKLDKVHEALQLTTINFKAASGTIHAVLEAQMRAGKILGTGSYNPARREYEAELHADRLEAERLQTLGALKIPVRGEISIDAAGRGNVARPEFQVTLAAARLEFQGQEITDVRVHAALSNDVVRMQVNATALQTAMHGEATARLRGDFEASGWLDAPRVPLAPILAVFAHGMAADVSGETAVHASFAGPLKDPERLEARIELPALQMHYGKVLDIAAVQAVQLDLEKGVLTAHPVEFRGSGTDLQVHGEVPLRSRSPMDVEIHGEADMRLLQVFEKSLASSGQARLDVHLGGAVARPVVRCEIQLSGLNVSAQGWPAGLQNGKGSLRVSGSRLEISNFEGAVGGGTLRASGGVALQPGVHFNVAMSLREVRVQYPPTLRTAVSADFTLTGTPEAAQLDGSVRMESASVTPEFDFANFIGRLTAPGGPVPTGFAQDLALNLTMTTPNRINISSRDFSLQGGAALKVRGTAADPRVLGRIDLTGGDLVFRGNRYVLQAGTLSFYNPNEIVPDVNLTAATTIQEYELHLRFQGPADNLHSTYTSNPPLPPADIISLLAFGQTREATAAGLAPGSLGAENLIASTVTGQITNRVQRIAGISQLSVDPVLGGGQQQAGTRITLQQRVTANLFVTVAGDVSSSQRNVVAIQYRISPRVALGGVFNQNGGAGVNVKIRKIW